MVLANQCLSFILHVSSISPVREKDRGREGGERGMWGKRKVGRERGRKGASRRICRRRSAPSTRTDADVR
jgi:hypothetical protein